VSGKKVIVIGGGASGLMAAGQAAIKGAEVLILEKMKRPARKLRITGKGRCNLTNNAEKKEFLSHFRAGSRFLNQAFARFFSNELITFLEQLGVNVELERGGRYFPKDNRAEDVVDAMVQWVKSLGVKIYTDSPVKKLFIGDGGINGVKTANRTYRTDAVILATGGKSYPATGSSGDGYEITKDCGHTIISPRPSLVPVTTKGGIAEKLQGLSLKNISVRLYIDSRKKSEEFGEMLFTHYGLSGPVILSLSRLIVDALHEKRNIQIAIDLKPALDDKKLNNRLLRDFKEHGKKKFKTILNYLLPRKLIPVCISLTNIDPEKTGNHITSDERKRLRLWLKDFIFDINGHRGFNEAIITAGGVSTKEINPLTMESKIIKNLYFAGEIIDIDADTGGYNLQAAFSTGFIAGQSAAH
jgi:predicted Rossmann fold flavoprotein